MTFIVSGPAAVAQEGGSDPLDAQRRLQELAASLEPLPDTGSGITRDVGAVAVIEHDGSNYDKDEPGGGLNYAARARVALRFYQAHGDFYDFLVVFTNFEFATGEATAFHSLIRNDVTGIGFPVTDGGSLFGSPGRLRGYIDMAALARYGRPPLSLRPGDTGFRASLNVLAHELAHQWLAQVRFRDDAGNSSTALLGRDGAHWSYLLDSDASVLYGSDWVANGDGTFRAARVLDAYSSLDLYLMGFLDPARVGPITLLKNSAVDATQLPAEDAIVTAVPETVRIGQIVAAEGPRQPDHLSSPKSFRLGFIVLTSPGVEPAPEDLAAVDTFRQAFAAHFFALTRGVAIADTTLAEAPPLPPAPAPDLARALAWLLAQQSLDGRWEDSSATAIRDTQAVLAALLQSGEIGIPYQRGRLWINAAQAANLDFTARRALALALTPPDPQARAALVTSLLAQQNEDGGFGPGLGFESDALDTALALRALSALGHPVDTRVRGAIDALGRLRSALGGWSVVPGGETSTVVTAHALLALQDWSSVPDAATLVAPGLATLVARRNPDGGFGESPSTAYASALALDVLLRAGASPEITNGIVAFLQATQLTDGSWTGSRHETALVLAALRNGLAPNLVVPADGLVLDPASATEGQAVRVTARIRNSGRTPAPATVARLFDGAPPSGAAVADAAVPPLDPGAEAVVVFDFPTTEAGARMLFVVADAAGEVAEAREDDNAASRALTVEGVLPDLTIGLGDLIVSPDPPEDGETVEVAITVRNLGQRAAPSTLVRLVDGNPRQGGRVIGEATAPPIAEGQAATVVIAWNTAGAVGDHVLYAVGDASFAVNESQEVNNERTLAVRVTPPLPPGPDLAVSGISLTPSLLSTLPVTVEARVLVRSLGRDAVTSTVALYDSDPPAGPPIGEQPVSLGPRSSTTLVFSVVVSSGGTRPFLAVADPAGAVAETDETNNQARTLLVDPKNTLDVAVDPSPVPSGSELVVGDRLTVTAVVRNRGTIPVQDVPVILALRTDTGVSELARAAVSLAAGATTPVALSWTTTVTGEPVPFVVRVDPFDALPELSETNNDADVPVTVGPSVLPNLRVSGADVQFDPDPPREGEAATVSVLVRNPSVVAAGPFLVRFFRGDPDAGGSLIGEAAVEGAAANSSTVASTIWSPVDVRGAQGIFVLVDPVDQVQEYDETDNQAFRPSSVLGLPDLVLTTGDVVLLPAYPRAGEAVTIQATVRNLGAQTSSAALLRAFEGEVASGVVVGEVVVPPLSPSEPTLLTFSWTPAAPPGERVLSVLVDAQDTVREQSEGNNLARRTVIVQDADLFLTEPYFSPNGDGVKDETVLAYRATVPVTIVVSNSRGQQVRQLTASAATSGSVVWDGRDDRGVVVLDGSYAMSVLGEGGAPLDRAVVVVDSDRSPILDATGTGLVAIRNATCRLPPYMVGPAWTAGEDEWLFIVYYPTPGYPAGLIRVTLDGLATYVSQDDFYRSSVQYLSDVRFASENAVAPDGREVLVVAGGAGVLHAVDLLTGVRRQIRSQVFGAARWSPDGRFIATDDAVITRDGTVTAQLPVGAGYSGWLWSPDGQFLASGNQIVGRDGGGLREIPLPEYLAELRARRTIWRPDGRIDLDLANDACEGFLMPAAQDEPERICQALVTLDPVAGTVVQVSLSSGDLSLADMPAWAPDGGKYISGGEVFTATGDRLGPLVSPETGSFVDLSPHAGAAQYRQDTHTPSCVFKCCTGPLRDDRVAVTSLLNLTVEVRPERLPGNNGILVRGTVSDAHLDHYQLDYAPEAEPENWRPLGPASDLPVTDDVMAVWVPEAPGAYLLRLRAYDRAGNARTRVRLVSWDRVPTLVNVTQSEFLISPNDDGFKDAARFDYLVMEPTRVEVQITGPEAKGATVPGPTVRRMSFEYANVGPAGFSWDGRDDGGTLVADGRYTVLVNDLPFRVEVDTTPPDIGWRYGGLQAVSVVNPYVSPRHRRCVAEPNTFGVATAQAFVHVVDAHLRSWRAPDGFGDVKPVYELERDSAGQVIFEDGIARPKLIDGRPVARERRAVGPPLRPGGLGCSDGAPFENGAAWRFPRRLSSSMIRSSSAMRWSLAAISRSRFASSASKRAILSSRS